MMMPASLKIATLFPLCAIRPRRVALPFRDPPKDENVSDCIRKPLASFHFHSCIGLGERKGKAYRRIDDGLVPRIVVDVNCDAPQCAHFGRELVEARVILAFALVGFGHGGLAEGI